MLLHRMPVLMLLLFNGTVALLPAQAASTQPDALLTQKAAHHHQVTHRRAHHRAAHRAITTRRPVVVRQVRTVRKITVVQRVVTTRSSTAVGRLVHVYFPHTGGTPHKSNPFNLQPVPRRVPLSGPVTGAMQALLMGPRVAERAAGFERLDTAGLSLGALKIRHGHVSVNFIAASTKGWLGDLSPVAFKEAVIWTVRHMTGATVVRVSVNGDPNFDSLKG